MLTFEEKDKHDEDHDHKHDHGAKADHAHEDGHAHEGEEHPHEHAEKKEVTPADADAFFMDMGHLFHHVQDSYEFEVPQFMVNTEGKDAATIGVPNLTLLPKGYGKMSKFMFNELLVGVILCVLFIWLGKKMAGGGRPIGRLWNLLETFVVYVRDEIAIPTIGEKDYKRFLPFLLTCFFFILGLNLLGMLPFFGSATGSIAVTAVLALFVFGIVAGSGIQKMGFVGFLKAQVPHMDLPFGMGYVLIPMMFVIEIFGFLVKHVVLAIRLFANMFAGHLVLAIFLAFIGVASLTAWSYVVTPVAVLASVGFSVLELLVAFLQAYVFTFLASLFIGSAQHAH